MSQNLQISKDKARQVVDRLQADPEYFVTKILGAKPWAKQLEIIRSVRDNRITSVRSCHGAGKSFISARIALWYLLSHPNAIVVTTAPTARQVEKVLWGELNTAHRRSKVPLGGNCQTKEFKLSSSWYAIGLSTNEPDTFQGFHADHLLAIADEAAGIEEPIFTGIKGITTGANNRTLYIGNPTSLGGTFYDSHRSPIVSKIKISVFDTPNFTINNITCVEDLIEAIESKRELKVAYSQLISPIAAYEDLRDWGADSPMFQARILGEFPDQPEDTLIPLNKIEAAMTPERREAYPAIGKIRYGVDVARFGSDRTVIAERVGDHVTNMFAYAKEDTMQTAGRVSGLIQVTPDATIFIDTIGVGSGVFDRLNELRNEISAQQMTHSLVGVNVAERAIDPERFINRRAEVYWNLREKFILGEIALPDDKELMSELSQLKFKFTSRGQIQIEEKQEMKKRLGKSPDRADALMLTYAQPPAGSFTEAEQTKKLETAGFMDMTF